MKSVIILLLGLALISTSIAQSEDEFSSNADDGQQEDAERSLDSQEETLDELSPAEDDGEQDAAERSLDSDDGETEDLKEDEKRGEDDDVDKKGIPARCRICNTCQLRYRVVRVPTIFRYKGYFCRLTPFRRVPTLVHRYCKYPGRSCVNFRYYYYVSQGRCTRGLYLPLTFRYRCVRAHARPFYTIRRYRPSRCYCR